MTRFGFRWVPLCISALAGMLSAQAPAKVDFARDVLPLFRQNIRPIYFKKGIIPAIINEMH